METKSRLLENIFSMVTLRGTEYFLAFLIVPYLLRTLGPTRYGSIALMQSIIVYFTLVINYGFNLTAPRNIALADDSKLPKIFSGYFWGTFFLWFGCSVLFGLGYWIYSSYFGEGLDIPLFFACYTSAVGAVLFPIWFFQGVQQMRYITLFNLTGRIIAVGLLFYLIRSPEDYVIAALLQSCTTVFSGILSWIVIHSGWPGILCRPVLKDVWALYKNDWDVFLSSLAFKLYTSSDVIILGMLTNSTVVGYYSGAEKLIVCARRGIGAVSDAIYPFISQKFKESKDMALSFLRKQLIVYLICGVSGGFMILFLSPVVVPWLLGDKYISSVSVLQAMSFVPLAVAVNTVFGYETMLPLRIQKAYSQILIAASILNLVIIVPFIVWKGALGVAFCIMITETFIMIATGWILWKKRILLRKNP
jgi:PST family polysaccharide transporter